MTEVGPIGTRPTDPVGRVLYAASRALALLGGVMMCGLAVLVTVSVTGRGLASSPITGDFEIVATFTGLCVFAFLPYCQMVRGNILVDFFLSKAPLRLRAGCDALGTLAYGLIMVLETWRLTVGGIEMHQVGDKTMILAMQRWYSFPFGVACLALLVAVIFYTLDRDLGDVRRGSSAS